jgi:hypothetical protein
MAASIQDILRPITLTKVISRQLAASKWVLQFMGFEPGGRNEEFFGHGREGSYHVYDNTRKVGRGRAPGTAAGRAARQQIGRVPFVYPRMHEQIGLLAEEIHNIARIDDVRIRDEAGRDYIRRQTATLAQKAANFRTAQVFGMLRDELYVAESGDDWYFTYTSAGSLFRINHQMPAGNKTQMDMLGDGDIIDTSWDNPTANIPKHLSDIDAAFQELYGGKLRNVMCTSAIWQNILKNDHVASQAGIANTPFRTFTAVVGSKEDGSDMTETVGELTCCPGVKFWITDEGLDLGAPGSETFTKYIGGNEAIFMPDPDTTDIFSLMLGSEPISEYDNGPESVKAGMASWSKKASNPTETEVFVLDNSLAVNHIPNSTAYGTVVF